MAALGYSGPPQQAPPAAPVMSLKSPLTNAVGDTGAHRGAATHPLLQTGMATGQGSPPGAAPRPRRGRQRQGSQSTGGAPWASAPASAHSAQGGVVVGDVHGAAQPAAGHARRGARHEAAADPRAAAAR